MGRDKVNIQMRISEGKFFILSVNSQINRYKLFLMNGVMNLMFIHKFSDVFCSVKWKWDKHDMISNRAVSGLTLRYRHQSNIVCTHCSNGIKPLFEC